MLTENIGYLYRASSPHKHLSWKILCTTVIRVKFYHHCQIKCQTEFTLCLHPCAYECERIAGQLAAGARDGPAAHQHQNSRVSWVFGVVRQPGVLQALGHRREVTGDWKKKMNQLTSAQLHKNELLWLNLMQPCSPAWSGLSRMQTS